MRRVRSANSFLLANNEKTNTTEQNLINPPHMTTFLKSEVDEGVNDDNNKNQIHTARNSETPVSPRI